MVDGAIALMTRDLDFETMRIKPQITFLNGEYWGILNVRDRINDNYLSIKYNIEKSDIELGENNEVDNSSGDYEALIAFTKSADFSIQSNYNYLKTKVDINSLIDYIVTESFFANWDVYSNNYAYWRYKGTPQCNDCPLDGKWRWILFDMDNSFDETLDPYEHLNNYRAVDFFYPYIKVNQEFRREFVNRYCDLVNSYFKPQHTLPYVDSLKAVLSPEINYQIQRWNNIDNYAEWESHINEFKGHLNARGDATFAYTNSEFSLSGTYNLTVATENIAKGFVKVNSIEIRPQTPGITLVGGSWTGKYFKNLNQKIVAIPKANHIFSHWVKDGVNYYDDTLSINTSSNVTYTAYFDAIAPSPPPAIIKACEYKLTEFDELTPAGTYPKSMKFFGYTNPDPVESDIVLGDSITGSYSIGSKTRINGLGENGISFINTSSANTGYPAGGLGAAVLSLDTRFVDSVFISWTGRTVTANSRKYAIKLMYRDNVNNNFQGFPSNVVYYGANTSGHFQTFNNIKLPAIALNKELIQVKWKYYYDSGSSGPRDQLAIDDIKITTKKINFKASDGSPNSFNVSYLVLTNKQNIISNDRITASKSIELKPGFDSSGLQNVTFTIEGCLN